VAPWLASSPTRTRRCAAASRSRALTLSLDATADVHTRVDRATLELRRVLADLVSAVTTADVPK